MYHSFLAQLIAIKKGEQYANTMTWIRTRTSFALMRSFFFFFKKKIKIKCFFMLLLLLLLFLTKRIVNSVLSEYFFLGELIGF